MNFKHQRSVSQSWWVPFDQRSFQLGIKRMLHLIWSKNNNQTSEDGKSSRVCVHVYWSVTVASTLIPFSDMEPTRKQQVNRITKYMIE